MDELDELGKYYESIFAQFDWIYNSYIHNIWSYSAYESDKSDKLNRPIRDSVDLS